ncbi:ABC transporter ATP-binding protein [Bifidobacterium sp. CP2]|uniref:ABC transporter ATP-binding protein n=1 Tax=Bifidobacterium sp. CP2 TaxID=2809025 RepID=UPI001BDBEE11|nr:ABC transporter ATP-binding protein [Bifidobacterium sp. CP2]MBT1182291.1 ABC transporter ATP-binding protein [Bifidobacterium sp. CP2]
MTAHATNTADNANAADTTKTGDAAGVSVTLDGVGRSFGDVSVLDAVDLTIPAGQFVSVVGKSGCGKTTLLRLIAGLDRPSAGTIRLDGVEQHGLNPATRVMFQQPRLLPWKTVEENVLLGLGKEHADEARDALDQVGLLALKDALPRHLSGGQAQRVALARALASKPRLLLLDEPLGALDALTRYSMQDLIHTIWERERFTAVLVTHDVSEAVYLSDRVLMVRDHRIGLDEAIDLPYPRNRAITGFTAKTTDILDAILDERPAQAA